MENPFLGYINMAIGLVGIVVSILTAPNFARIAQGGSAGQDHAAVIGRNVRLFGSLLILITFIFVLALGMVLTIMPVAQQLGAAHPSLVAVLTVAGLFMVAIAATLFLNKLELGVAAILAAIELALLGIIAGTMSDLVLFIIAGMISFVLLLIVAGVTSPDYSMKPSSAAKQEVL